MTFAQRLKTVMDETNMTRYRLAKELGVHQSTVNNWLIGKSTPKYALIQKIAAVFDCSEAYLLRDINPVVDIFTGEAAFSDVITIKTIPHESLSPQNSALLAAFNKLNNKGQQVAVERVEELTKIPDYQKTEEE